MKAPKITANLTPQTHEREFRNALMFEGFQHATWHTEESPQFDAHNKAGHPILRVCIDREGEIRPHSITVIRLDGTKAQNVLWIAENMSAAMPTTAIFALITETLKAKQAGIAALIGAGSVIVVELITHIIK